MVFAVMAMMLIAYPCSVRAQGGPSGSPSEGKGPDGGGPPGPSSGPPKPPPEAYKACEGKSAGATGQMTGRRGETVTGTCETMDGQMVLVPDFVKNRMGKKN